MLPQNKTKQNYVGMKIYAFCYFFPFVLCLFKIFSLLIMYL